MRVVSKIFALTLIVSSSWPVLAQSSLDRRVSMNFEGVSPVQALDLIKEETGLRFSYNPVSLPDREITQLSFADAPLSTVLKAIVGDDIKLIQRGNYMILQKPKAKSQARLTVKGKLLDAQSGEVIEDASVLDANTLTASLSDATGSYDLRVSRKYEEVAYLVSKRNYLDTLILLKPGEQLPETIYLKPRETEDQLPSSKVDGAGVFKTLIGDKIRNHMQNVSLGEERIGQVSLFPGVGTNGILAGKITNYASFNATVGLAYGIKGAEFSGAASIIRGDMLGVQFAGAASYVGGKMKGAQFAGAVNTNFDDAKGVQAAGAVNINRGAFNGAQISGAINNSRALTGLQAAGAANWSDDLKGVQIGGAFNYSHGSLKGLQISGAVNYVKDQVSGLQIAGFMNYAYTLKGVQIGVVNIINEDKGGVSIGLLNIVKGGLKKLEFSTNDVTPFNLSFRMGSRAFYNIYQVGIHPWSGEFWDYGIGIGTHFNFPKKLFANVEAIYLELRPLANSAPSNYNIAKFNLNMGYSFSSHFALVGGPILNIGIRDRRTPDRFSVEPNWLLQENDHVSMWLGYRLGVRF